MKIVHVYNQGLHHDVRTRRYGQALTSHFKDTEFYIVGQRLLDNDQLIERVSERFEIIRLNFFLMKAQNKFKAINFIFWLSNVFTYIIGKRKVKVISAHSLKVLPVCLVVAIFKRSKLFYDTHEIETHTTSNKFIIAFLSLLERVCMLGVDKIIVTSPGHKEWYEQKYKRSVLLVRNCPSLKEKAENTISQTYDLKQMIGIDSASILFIYIGVINVARGVNVILEAFQKCDKNKHILFLGFGDIDPINKLALEHKNIHYMKPVPPMELINYISTADVGIHMMDSSNLNHKKALPNKPMQYMSAGLPCIVSDVEIMSRLVKEADSGWVVKEGDVESLMEIVNSIIEKDIEYFRFKSQKWFKENNWESESKKLIELYNS